MTSYDRTVVLDAAGLTVLQWPVAEAGDDLDYYLDVSAAINQYNDSINQVSASIKPSGVGELQPVFLSIADDNVIDIWLSGGVPGRVYTIKIDVTGSSNRIYSWLVTLPIDKKYSIPPFPLPPSPGFGPPIIFVNSVIELESGTGFWALENGVDAWVWG